ncbi:ribonuclease HII [Salinisphaera japonica]|uniref:Ribonuclease HII n=1 Tax=Salinisphaera japonica YTM-1 TaxID=1209778 RepID=A0A423PLN9_9GAMM|nr:ribonuclease HII [Salinisphaera japonica]ROO26536.1 ribonuclease HII [Salinisphaera japonica YTM-1]
MKQRRHAKFACPLVAGVDEVGRGPLAGPVVAAAVILAPRPLPRGLTDSKALSEADRDALDIKIRDRAIAWCVAEASVAEIDSINILQATLLAMRRAVAGLALRPTAVWVDGNRSPGITGPLRCVVGGDGQVPAISAASVIAKVARDRQMADLDAQFPGYGLAAHKGYGTPFHREALQRLGPTPIHRTSFAPVARAAGAGQRTLDLG